MKIRAATSADRDRVRAIAADSLRSSYSLSPQQIESIVEGEFGDERLDDRFVDPDAAVFVAEDSAGDTEQIQGFVDIDTENGRRLQWLHVDPQARGNGIGTALLEFVRKTDPGTPLTAHVLADAVEGGEFLEGFGLERHENVDVQIGDEEYSVVVFREGSSTVDPTEPTVPVPASVTIDGSDHPIDVEDRIPGRSAPFFSIYTPADHTEPYGYFCSHCAGTDVAADGLDRLECGECGNVHLADEWDDSYL